jgi:hypothetical protein
MTRVSRVGKSLRLAFLLALAATAGGAGATELTAAQAHVAPVGRVEARDGALALRGEPGVEQAVVIWPGLALDATQVTHATIEHEGLAPSHQLSLFFRNDDGEHFVELPRTLGSATVALDATQGWTGTVVEVGLVYGPAGNVPTLLPDDTLVVRSIAFEGPGGGVRTRAALTRFAAIEPRIGSNINVLPRGGAFVAGGAVLALSLLVASLVRGRARRLALATGVLAFLVAEAAMWRQWLVLHDDASRIAQARRAASLPLDLDVELVQIGERLRTALAAAPQPVAVRLSFEDPFVAQRLRFHLLPLRAATLPLAAAERRACLLDLGDRATGTPLLSEETAFGALVLSVPADAPKECRWNSLPLLR